MSVITESIDRLAACLLQSRKQAVAESEALRQKVCELQELRMEIERLKSGVRDIASLCTNCNNLDDAQDGLWKLLDGETPRSGCAPCEWDAMEDRYKEARRLLLEVCVGLDAARFATWLQEVLAITGMTPEEHTRMCGESVRKRMEEDR